MSIDREFRFLNKSWDSLNNWASAENSVNEWIHRPSKMVDFVKSSTLKYLFPVLMVTAWWIAFNKSHWDKTAYDESAAPLILEDYDTSFKIDPNKLYTWNYLFEGQVQGIDDNTWGMVYDGKYDYNHVSGVTLDEEFDYAPWTHIFQTTKEDLYMTLHRKLSTEDYQNLFKWLKDLRQWSLGNCYFVVAIKNLARSKYFDTLMMTSVEREGDDSFNLYMPLWEPWWVKISITKEDLEAATIWWPLWYKILEIWFSKYLLFKKWIIHDTNMTITNDLMKKMKKWSAWETTMSLLWPKSFINKCIKNEASNKLKILDWLRNYDPKNLWIISATSKFKQWKTDKNFYEIWWKTIYYGHAYCVCGVEKEWFIIKSVILENPWNNDNIKWWWKIKLSIDDFLNGFSLVNIGHATDNLLNLSTTYDEIKVVDSRDRRKS